MVGAPIRVPWWRRRASRSRRTPCSWWLAKEKKDARNRLVQFEESIHDCQFVEFTNWGCIAALLVCKLAHRRDQQFLFHLSWCLRERLSRMPTSDDPFGSYSMILRQSVLGNGLLLDCKNGSLLLGGFVVLQWTQSQHIMAGKTNVIYSTWRIRPKKSVAWLFWEWLDIGQLATKIFLFPRASSSGICLESWKNEALFSTAWYKLDVLRRELEVISSLFDPLGLISLRRCLCQWHRAGIEGREMQNCCVPWSDSIQLHLEHAILFTWLYFNKDICHFVWKFLWLALVQFLLRMPWQISLSQSLLPTGCLLGPSSLTLVTPHLFQGNSWAVEQWEPGVQPAWKFGLATQRRHWERNCLNLKGIF